MTADSLGWNWVRPSTVQIDRTLKIFTYSVRSRESLMLAGLILQFCVLWFCYSKTGERKKKFLKKGKMAFQQVNL
jgi:hypothetical protein